MKSFVGLFLFVIVTSDTLGIVMPEIGIPQQQCELIRIDMCKSIGYNETAMPNLVGHELQSDVKFTLETFVPLIDFKCSTQIKLFLCSAYLPMCTRKISVPIGPCRSLCETVRFRCNPVLQSFGFPWPPALDCTRFPEENNQQTMCMEGPGESSANDDAAFQVVTSSKAPSYRGDLSLQSICRSGRCIPRCDVDILFGQNEKHLAEIWVATWSYASLGLAVVATLCIILIPESKSGSKWLRLIIPLVWCHNSVTIGWCVRFFSGRKNNPCGAEAQLPNISNASCAATFLLRYYFGMAACAWWSILCLDWHRSVRRSPDAQGHLALTLATKSQRQHHRKNNMDKQIKTMENVTQSNLARFTAWGLPAFQTAAVIVSRLVDSDELLGACFVGNQSDIGLQVLVATPLFCYWIFGSMNLISGYLVLRRNKNIISSTNSTNIQQQFQRNNSTSGYATFLTIYFVPCTLLLMAVIYEFANIDNWLNVSPSMIAKNGFTTPLWPFLTKAFMELMLGIICSAWALGPKISTMYRQKLSTPKIKQQNKLPNKPINLASVVGSSQNSNVAYTTVSYQTIRQQHPEHSSSRNSNSSLSMQQMSKYSSNNSRRSKLRQWECKQEQQLPYRHGHETIL